MNRRSFLGLTAAAAAGFVLDPELALWRPGAKTCFLPPIVTPPPIRLGEFVVFNSPVLRRGGDARGNWYVEVDARDVKAVTLSHTPGRIGVATVIHHKGQPHSTVVVQVSGEVQVGDHKYIYLNHPYVVENTMSGVVSQRG